jgi:hypothetical protein
MKAFPTTKPLDSWDDPHQGMDLRDYFASKAMQGLLATISYEHSTGDISDMEIANRAYLIADAMMKAREQ